MPKQAPLAPHPSAQLKPFIDKISVILDPLEEDAHDIHSGFWSNIADKDVFQSAGPKALGKWKRAYLIALGSTHYRPLLQYRYEGAGAAGKATKIRLEFNPRKLGEQGLSDLHSVLISLWPQGWSYVIEHGHMSRIDIAVDVPNIRMDEIRFVPKQAASEIRWGRDGHLESFRHGNPQGNQTLVYSVKKKRQAKGQPYIGPSRIRVERRLRSPSPSMLPKLGELKNPFADLSFTTMPGPPPDDASKEWMWSMFEDSVQVRGVENALALVPTDRRSKYRAYLKQHPQPWWDPAIVWQSWPEAYLPLLTCAGSMGI